VIYEMKQIYSVLIAFLVLLSVSGLGAAVTITGLADVSTADTTPTITFTVTGNNSSYVANLFIDSVASGTVEATNATEVSITCNQTLASGFTGTYYVTAYNVTEIPATTTSTTYNMTTSNFAGIVVVLGDVVSVFSPIVDLIIAVGTIMIAIAMIVFIMGIISGLFKYLGGGLGKMGG
jgi:hypothetical protein